MAVQSTVRQAGAADGDIFGVKDDACAGIGNDAARLTAVSFASRGVLAPGRGGISVAAKANDTIAIATNATSDVRRRWSICRIVVHPYRCIGEGPRAVIGTGVEGAYPDAGLAAM